MTENLSYYLSKAQEYLTTAHTIMTTPIQGVAITSAYYAFFWTVRGLLFEKDIITKRHSGARDMFALHFIKTGELPVKFGNDFAVLYDRRQLADYTLDGNVDAEFVADTVRIAEEFVAFINQKYA